MVDGQTMVDHWLQKPGYETCGPGSSPLIDNLFFMYLVRLSLRIIPVQKFRRKILRTFKVIAIILSKTQGWENRKIFVNV
jgi:hypothetical protein